MKKKNMLRRRTILATATAVVATGVPAPALVFNTTFSSNVAALPYAAQVESAFNYAEQQYAGLYSNNMTINVNVNTESGPPSELGNSTWSLNGARYSYSTIRNALAGLSATPDQISAAAYLPSSDPSNGGQWSMSRAEQKALGLLSGTDSGLDGTFLFNTNQSYTFDPYDRTVTGDYDFIGVAEHELSEIMGRGAGLGDQIETSSPVYLPLDLYRFSSPGFHNLNSTSSPIFFSIDDGNTNLKEYNYTTGQDLQDWDSIGTVADSYNAQLNAGVQNSISNVDATVMDVIGYDRESNVLTWNGGTHDFLTDNNWSTSSQPGINPHFGAFLYMDTVSAAVHAFSANENYTLSSNSDMGQTIEVSQGAFIIGLSGSPSPNSAGLLINQDGLLLVDTSGTMDIAADLSVGDAEGTTNGLAELFENGQLHVGTYSGATQVLYVGNSGTGQLYQNGNSDVSTPTLSIGETTTGNGSYYLSNSSTLFVNGNEIIADYGSGLMYQSGGAQTITGTLSLGTYYKSQATMTMTGGTLTAAYERIGISGAATFTQQGGSQTISNDITIAEDFTSTSTLTVSGGTLQDNGNTYVGGASTTPAGDGILNISGGAMTVNGTLQDYEFNGIVNLSSGSLTVGAISDGSNLNDNFSWTGGTLHLTAQPLDIINTDPNNENPLGGSLTLANGQTLQVDSTESLSGNGSAVAQKTGSANTCSTLQIGSGGNYNLSGGTLSASEVDLNPGGTFAESSAAVTFTTFNQTGGSATFSDGLTLAPGVYNLSGGTLTTTGSGDRIGYLNLVTDVGGAGTFNQTGGTYTTPGLNIGFENIGTFNLGKFGILNVTGAVNIGEFSYGSTFTDDGIATLGTLFVFGYPQTTVTIDGGSLTSGSTTNYGTITQTGGSSNLGALAGSYGTLNVGTTSPASKVPTQMVVAALQQGTVNIQTQGLLKVTGGTNNVVDSLTISSGYLDLTNSQLFVDYGSGPDPIASIAAWVASGYAGKAWNGTGIMSSVAQTNSGSYGIGYADSADPGNPAGLAAGQIEIMYTLLGDANLDAKVNGTDFDILATNFNKAVTASWDKGDFNYDGNVNGSDFVLLADNFNQFASQSATSATDLTAIDTFAATYGLLADVPEPACIAMITLAGMVTIMRPRRSLRPRASQTAQEPSAD